MNKEMTFELEAPEVALAYFELMNALKRTTGLDPKTKQLIFIGIKCASGAKNEVLTNVPIAKCLGATREEIRDTILLTLCISGIKGVSECLADALEIYDTSK